MRKIIPLTFIVLLISCSVRITTKASKKRTPITDSVLVLSIDDTTELPDTTFLIGSTSIKSPFQGWIKDGRHYPRLLVYAKSEAKKIGGNVIKITDYYNYLTSKHFSSKLTANIYSINEPAFSIHKKKMDSLATAYKNSIKNSCIVHFKNECTFYGKWCNDEIFLNDSLIIHFRETDSLKKTLAFNLTLKKGGILSSKFVMNADSHEKINLELGQEYYVIIYNPVRPSNSRSSSFGINTDKVYFGLVTKDIFENEGGHKK